MKNKQLLLENYEKAYGKKFVCKRPFELVEVDLNGDVYFCYPRCDDNSYKIGNLYQSSFEDICKSEKAVIYKKDILNSKYSYCNFENCSAPDKNLCFDDFNAEELMNIVYPKELRLHLDNICDVKCFMCRKEYIVKFDKEKEFKEILIPRILNMCQKAEIVFMNGQGEALYSPLNKELISKIAQTYPNIKFDFCTNGLKCNKENLQKLNIENRIKNISFSIHAASEKTYNKIIKGGNYKKLKENISYAKSLKSQNLLESISLNFVVNKLNYKEMIDFAKYASENNFTCFFSHLQNSPAIENNYDELSFKNHNHKDYKKLCKILQNKIFDNENCILDNQLQEIRNEKISRPKFNMIKLLSFFYKH